MFDNILRPFGFQRRNRTTRVRNAGGGLALPILGYLAYRYREPIGRFLRDKMGRFQQRGQTGVGGDIANPTPQPF
jgi:hypothetical protein